MHVNPDLEEKGEMRFAKEAERLFNAPIKDDTEDSLTLY